MPQHRRLRGFTFDPSLSGKLDTVLINERVYEVPWEDLEPEEPGPGPHLGPGPGPVGEYVEVVDYDPASGCWYDPVDLNHPHLLAQDGLPPSSTNPQFHQQMVYAVVMTTIRNFERALGRRVMWSDREPEDLGKKWKDLKTLAEKKKLFVPRLRVYPHALREPNAYYSPAKKALLFGYFPASEAGDIHYPGGIVFSCLSHDIIAHETTHAILDGIYPKFMEVTQPDGFAFHEAFADIVALFQHFTFEEAVRHQIAKTRGDLEMHNLMGQLAQEFGAATGNRGSLRDALGEADANGHWKRRPPDPRRLETTMEPHDRGAILVSAVFDAFIAIYNSRIADLKRIATGGSGILQAGELHPDLVRRLANEAVRSARHVLKMCIRALDYCPPVDIDFGDYLRAIVTADLDVMPDDPLGYRVAFLDAFRQHGIYPRGLRSLSEESLAWETVEDALHDFQHLMKPVAARLRKFFDATRWHYSRELQWESTLLQRGDLHDVLRNELWSYFQDPELQKVTGLDFSITDKNGVVQFQVHALWPVRHQRDDGATLNQVVFTLLQHTTLDGTQEIWGGCTVIFDLDRQDWKYIVRKPLYNQDKPDGRITRARRFFNDPETASLAATYGLSGKDEPFALLHAEL